VIDPLLFSSCITYPFYTDLAERFRDLAAGHASVKAAEAYLELAHVSYQSSIVSFAKDLDASGKLHGRNSTFWVESGLCETKEDVELMFAAVDSSLTKLRASAPENLGKVAYHTHSCFLNAISLLNGEASHVYPDVPKAPTFESKHAFYAPATAEANSSQGSQGTADPPLCVTPLTAVTVPAAFLREPSPLSELD
jgi:hypothetical protein